MGMMSLRRRVIGGKKNLPYDAEIEYLQSSGAQYIDTGIKAEVPLLCEALMLFLNKNDTEFLGARELNKRFYLLHNFSGWCLGYGGYYTSSLNYDNTTIHNVKSFLSEGSQYMEVDGIKIIEQSVRDDNSLDLNLFLFAMNYNGRPLQYCYSRLYSCKIGNVRDFIPVRVGTTGYLYDKVSGELFGNIGTGNFILGPDKN